MEATHHTIPLDRTNLRAMKQRFPDALRGTYDPASDDFVPKAERTSALIRRHLFDCLDGMRLHVSLHTQTEAGPVIHAQAAWLHGDDQPVKRSAALEMMTQRMETLIESLDGVKSAPEPLDAGVSERGVPHVFYPYPLAFSEATDSA
jgi:hypothetical protein